jgi:hypothetical protein
MHFLNPEKPRKTGRVYVIGHRYFHEITLRDNPPFHSLTDLDSRKNLRVTGKKKAKTA